jgi:Flp pilus assembly pilin Flp
MSKLLSRCLREESGTEVIEYALLLGLVVVGCIAVLSALGVKVVGRLDPLFSTRCNRRAVAATNMAGTRALLRSWPLLAHSLPTRCEASNRVGDAARQTSACAERSHGRCPARGPGSSRTRGPAR